MKTHSPAAAKHNPKLHFTSQLISMSQTTVVKTKKQSRKASSPFETHPASKDISKWDEAWFNHYE